MGLRNLQAEELEPMFKTAKEFLLKDWKEAENEKPYRQALDLMPKMLFKVISRERLMVTMLDKYDFLQFKSDLQTWLINGTMQWFIHGNFTKEQALSIVDASQNILSLKQVSVDQLAKVAPILLKEGTATVYQNVIADQENTQDCIFSYHQVGIVENDIQTVLCNSLLRSYLTAPFIKEMKNNKKHLRPAVKESYERGLLGLWFILSSEGENSEHLSQSIN